MSIEILMPALSPTMTEGTLVKWRKKEGDDIKPGDLIADVETDKAIMEIEAADYGVLGKILVNDGTTGVKVGELLAVILEEGESLDKAVTQGKVANLPHAPLKETRPNCCNENHSQCSASPEMSRDYVACCNSATRMVPGILDQRTSGKDPNTRIFASPLARAIATQNNLDILFSNISGSGPNGRIMKDDILKFVNTKNTQGSNFNADKGNENKRPEEILPISPMRRVIAERLTYSKQTAPHFYLTTEYDVDDLLVLRAKLNEVAKIESKQDVKISITDVIIKAIGLSLEKVPAMKVSWKNDHIVQYSHSDIAIAINIEAGLVTPVIQDIAKKTLFEISQELKILVQRAKNKQLNQKELQGGSLTLSNLGMFDVDNCYSIINPPQSTILAVGSVKKRPIVKGDCVVAANTMFVTLSCDHRVIDGAVAAQFLHFMRQYLEVPALLFV